MGGGFLSEIGSAGEGGREGELRWMDGWVGEGMMVRRVCEGGGS